MPDLRSLFDELMRRKVFRTAGVYAVVAWMVIEVTSVVAPALGLPEWTLALVILLAAVGFPLVLTLEWVFETTAEGVRRTPEVRSGGEARSLVLRPVGMSAVALVVVGLGAWHFWPRAGVGVGGEADAPMAQASVAVLPFDVRGGADIAYLREGMVDLLSTKLEGTRSFRPLDPRTVLAFLTREGVDPADPEVARSISRRFGAAHYVQGSVLEFEGNLQVKAALYRLDGDGRAVVEAAVEGSADQLFALVDDLAVEILTAGTGGSVSRLTRLAALTTDSLSALKAYLEGESAYRAGQWQDAMAGYGRAVEIDSTFALAHYRLAGAASWAERGDVGGAALDAAVAHAGRLSAHDRMLVEAQHSYREGRNAEAAGLYRRITGQYPDDVEAWYQFGEVLMHKAFMLGSDPAETRRAFSRAVELDPELYPALWHLSTFVAIDGDLAELDSVSDAILRLNPDDDVIRAQRAVYRGEWEDAEPVLERLARGAGDNGRANLGWLAVLVPRRAGPERVAGFLTTPDQAPAWRAVGHVTTGAVRLASGRWRAATASLRTARSHDPALALAMHAYLALLVPPGALEEGDLAGLRDDLAAWDGAGSEPAGTERSFAAPHAGLHPYVRLYLLGLVEARLGRPDDAVRRADALDAAEPPAGTGSWVEDLAAVVRAEALRARGEPDRALEALAAAPLWTTYHMDERLSPIVGHWYPAFLRAELLRETGRGREALRWYGAFFFPSDPVTTVATLRRAGIHASLGDDARAAELYGRLEEAWGDADGTFVSLLPAAVRQEPDREPPD